MIQSIILLACGALVFPLFFIYPFTYYKTVQYLFTLPSLSALSLTLIFLSPAKIKSALREGKLYIILSLIFLIVPIIHVFIYNTITLSEFFYSIIWITVPFFAFLYNEELKKILPAYFFIFLLFDIFNSALQTSEIVGIAGNRNWHAACLAVIIPFSLYLAKDIYPNLSKKIGTTVSTTIISIVFFITTSVSIYLIVICRTRTILVLFPLLLIVALFLEIREKHKKLMIFLLLAILIILGVLFTISHYSYKDTTIKPKGIELIQKDEKLLQTKLANTLNIDVRGPLWRGCMDLISKHPYLGTSAPRFESEYQLYRPIDYFTKPDNAVRSNHPHNSILYMSASYGIPGMFVWLILWALPMIVCLIRYYRLSTISKIVLFSYILLFIHGLMDLIFFEWPTVFFSAILLGILWGDVLKKPTLPLPVTSDKKKNSKTSLTKLEPFPKYIDYFLKTLGIIFLLITIRTVYLDTISSFYNRLGEFSDANGNKQQSVLYYEKGATLEKDPQYVYRAATTCLQDLNDTKKSLYFLDMFKDMSVQNYAHSNGFLALALVKEGRLRESLPYLLKEVVIYPLLIGSWYRLAYVQGTLGMKQDAEISFSNMMESLKYKNLPPNKRTIYFLLDNPVYDAHPDRIPPEDIKQLNAP